MKKAFILLLLFVLIMLNVEKNALLNEQKITIAYNTNKVLSEDGITTEYNISEEKDGKNIKCKKANLTSSDEVAFQFINDVRFKNQMVYECDFLHGSDIAYIKYHLIYNFNKSEINLELIEALKKQYKLPILSNFNDTINNNQSFNNHYFSFQLNIKKLIEKIGNNDFYCVAVKFDKVYNISEAHELLSEETENRFDNSNNYTLYFHEHGFYSIRCFKFVDPIYEYTYNILPLDMKTLIENRKNLLIKYTGKYEPYFYENVTRNDIKYKIQNKSFTSHDKQNSATLNTNKLMNVLILMIDAVSYYHFKRIFPLTYDYFRKNSNDYIIYSSLNSVGYLIFF